MPTTGTDIGCSVEAEKADARTRKVKPLRARKEPKLNQNRTVYPFKLQVDSSSVEVVESLDPKEPVIRSGSLLDIGDMLVAQTIYGFCGRPYGKPIVTAATGRHQAQAISLRGFAFAEIEIPLRQMLEKKSRG